MKDAASFDVEGLVKGYLRGSAWHCTFYTPAGRQRRKLGSKNKRQAERRAREIAEFIQRENWEALAKLHNDGVIDDDEFEKRKRVALGEQSESE